ncbi:hypothetical protein [Streptomyces avermitilis]|uniref:hypothetical protein n=1 Tax=Streptomyces avermitilis TaxID=33903 RepID=UPI0033DFAF70
MSRQEGVAEVTAGRRLPRRVSARSALDGDLLRRCFGFVEAIYAGAGEYRRGAVYFQVLECLLGEGPYLEKALPYLRGVVRERVSRMLKHYAVEGYEHGLLPS